ncbi:hypothetical protein SAMN05192553_103615 [Cyclobacterium xiamenense]|uniref:Outer membrane protein beta-barrel domain-containing protein n=1 Tax=Cyclobacterium xiamenense TaxID=1297121 RepID=A0A1H6YBX8_9BACT|nr:hypothetical protein [Cyclobacterium xiamenense]SEJ38793.1 hypothetical protein SAMN05192553_103615 [Cyclobacterium xiamenense]
MLLWKSKYLPLSGVSLVFLFFMGTAFPAMAQRVIYPEDNPPLEERVYFGGNFSLQFGTVTFVDISPLAGAMITDKYSAGLGATYQYLNNRFVPNADAHIYGGRIFNRYNVLPRFFLHAEYEALNVEVANLIPNTNEIVISRDWVPGLFGGAGYFTPFGERGGINFMLLYNFSYDNIRSPYSEPYVIRVGFVF